MICMLVELLMSLRWQAVFVLHDLDLGHVETVADPLTLPSLEEAGISYSNYDISIFTEEHQLTFPEDLQLQQDLNYGLCDKHPKASVDFCHHSRVLIVGSHDYLDPIIDDNIQVENVAVLERPGTHKYTWEYGSLRINNYSVCALEFAILQHLSLSLNFSYNVIPPREDEWGRNINGSWTGVLGMLQRQEVDLSVDLLTIHSDRQDVAEAILPPVQQTRLMILYKKENDVDKDQLMVFLRPVLPTTVILFAVSVIFVTACLSFSRFSHTHHNQSQRNVHQSDMTETTQEFCMSVIAWIQSSLMEVYGASLKQGEPLDK
ncbi:glutamate receptor ionotropic, kainate glr-3-like [Haliotis asinina]|uniref:glutamate receptor ionotropic, kainate glr-3-like n=1 Tax=Haliotis asinina TaxID=109174 RepID=UPI0035321977